MGFITCTVFSFDSHAEHSVPEYQVSEAFLYFEDVIKSLSQMQEANQRIAISTSAMKETAGGHVEGISEFAAKMDAALEELVKAKEMILPYEQNSNPKIRESAQRLASGYEALRGFYSTTQQAMQDLYGGGHPQPFDIKKFAHAFADVDLEGQKARDMIAKSCLEAAQTLVGSPKRGNEGKLAISPEERDVLVSNIHSAFPKTTGKRWGSETEIDEAIWKILRVLEESPVKDEVKN